MIAVRARVQVRSPHSPQTSHFGGALIAIGHRSDFGHPGDCGNAVGHDLWARRSAAPGSRVSPTITEPGDRCWPCLRVRLLLRK